MTTMTGRITGADYRVIPDERDEAILAERIALLDLDDGPRVGDWVRFPAVDDDEPEMRRISYIWQIVYDDPASDDGFQTSRGGSWYLGNGYVSMSGSLYVSVPRSSLTLVEGETRPGSVWFFHHDWHQADSAVHAVVDFRVFDCSQEAPTS